MKLQKLGLLGSFAIYIPAAILLYALTKYLIPYLSKTTGLEPVIFWFIVGGLGVFMPLVITAILILKFEGYGILKVSTWKQRMRFMKVSKTHLAWCFGGIVTVGVLSVIIMILLELIFGYFNPSPPFMSFEPLTRGRYWILLIWLPFWILNIMGEEVLWRGVMFPRQEVAFGKYTWIIHGLGWAIFHIAFGWKLLVMLLPLLFIQSYVVQKTKNSWTGVIMHAVINGPSFVAIALGFI